MTILNFLKPVALHIPDGMLSLPVSIACWVLAVIGIGFALKKSSQEDAERQIPLMGVMAAFIFAAQMLNFPVAGGTSGHLLGGALAAIALGPWRAIIVMTSVVALQALLFQDGGLVVMGSNILNMGILTAIAGFGIYRIFENRPRPFRLAASGAAAWLSVMVAALATSLQLWLSGTARLDLVVPAMLGVHAIIGLGEALITVAALAFLFRMRPDILEPGSAASGAGRGWIPAGLLVVAALLIISPLAVADPDGLERVAEDLGFINTAQAAPFEILLDYTIPILGETPLSTILAGIIGALLVAALVGLVVYALRQKQGGPSDNLPRRT
jgi:cobalt/nickel transport system permease protein